MHCEGKLNLTLHNTSYCLIEEVTKAGLTVPYDHDHDGLPHNLDRKPTRHKKNDDSITVQLLRLLLNVKKTSILSSNCESY